MQTAVLTWILCKAVIEAEELADSILGNLVVDFGAGI